MTLSWIFQLSRRVFLLSGNGCFALVLLLLNIPVLLGLAGLGVLLSLRMSQFPPGLVLVCLVLLFVFWLGFFSFALTKAVRTGSRERTRRDELERFLAEQPLLYADILAARAADRERRHHA